MESTYHILTITYRVNENKSNREIHANTIQMDGNLNFRLNKFKLGFLEEVLPLIHSKSSS